MEGALKCQSLPPLDAGGKAKGSFKGTSSSWFLAVEIIALKKLVLMVLSWVSNVEAVVGRHKLSKEKISPRQ